MRQLIVAGLFCLALLLTALMAPPSATSMLSTSITRGTVISLIEGTVSSVTPYFRYTASQDQTEFYGNDDLSNSLIFGSKTIMVSVNGDLQSDTAYTKSSSPDKITFGSGLNSGDIVQVYVMAGAVGPAGADGLDGTTGDTGTAGTNGTNGLKSLVKATTESPGGNCTSGGQKIEVGIDDDDDNTLDAGEVDQTVYVCDGDDGEATGNDAIEFIIDGGGQAITTGIKGELEVPYACTIDRVTLMADQTGSIQVDVWKDTYANYPPTSADTITASATPVISSGVKYQDATLTGWTTSLSAGDILRYNVESASTITRVTISLKVTR